MNDDTRRTIKISSATKDQLFAAVTTAGQIRGERVTYDELIQAALKALAETPEYKRAGLPERLEAATW